MTRRVVKNGPLKLITTFLVLRLNLAKPLMYKCQGVLKTSTKQSDTNNLKRTPNYEGKVCLRKILTNKKMLFKRKAEI